MQNSVNKLTLEYRICSDPDVLQQIIGLQQKNIAEVLSSAELSQEGFVTVHHDLPLLQKICGPYGHAVAMEGDRLVAYALVMLKEYAADIAVLVPMFEKINQLSYQQQPLKEQPYLVMGQVCIDKAYRGLGVFSQLYHSMQRVLSADFTYLITEVALRNPRSIRAHQKVGFQCIEEYSTEIEDWQILLWDWKT